MFLLSIIFNKTALQAQLNNSPEGKQQKSICHFMDDWKTDKVFSLSVALERKDSIFLSNTNKIKALQKEQILRKISIG